MNDMTKPESSFERLSKINVNDKLEKKNGLSYLSWAWALDVLMRADPDAEWQYEEPKTYANETMMVFCTVTAFGKKKTAHLPVMNHKNQAIPCPNAFEINTAMQRCLVKAIALHGLGLYIYAGEDLPSAEQETHAAPVKMSADEIASVHVKLEDAAKQGVAALHKAWSAIPNEAKVALRDVKEKLKHQAADVDAARTPA